MPAVVGAGLRMTALPLASAGPDVLHGDVHREVPGRDRYDDAARLAERHHALAGVLDRDRLAGQPSCLGGGEPEAAGRRADLPVGLGPGLAVLDDEVVGQLVATTLDDIGHPLELGRALEGGSPAVAFERLVRQLDRPLDVPGPGRRDLGRWVARCRAHHDRGLAVFGVRPVPAHQELMTPGSDAGNRRHVAPWARARHRRNGPPATIR